MSRLFQYLGNKAVSGIVILLPIALIVIVLGDTVGMVADIVDPIAAAIPTAQFVGVEVRLILTLVALLGVLVVLGMLLETPLGGAVTDWLEHVLFNRIPGYTLAKSLTRGVAGRHAEAAFPVARVQLDRDGVEAIGLVVERHGEESCTVFVPLAPTPTLGSIYLVPLTRVRFLDVPATQALNTVMQWGIGVGALLERGSATPPAPPPAG